jgi:hypothetical protein
MIEKRPQLRRRRQKLFELINRFQYALDHRLGIGAVLFHQSGFHRFLAVDVDNATPELRAFS